MQDFRYLNIHTHRASQPELEKVLEIINLHEHFDAHNTQTHCSMGIHPWYIHDVQAQLEQLRQYSVKEHVLAIGECGLDKIFPNSMPLQESVFKEQITWANHIGKPLIIHCVRAYPEVLQLLWQAKVPVIFHGFRKKHALAQEILDKGHYLSFGTALLDNNTALQETFAQVPADRLFLETDDSAEHISAIYQAAAGIRKTGEDVIILQVQQNYKNVFGL